MSIETNPRTVADNLRLAWFLLYHQPYKLGNEAWWNIGGESGTDPLSLDCSGGIYSTMRKAGATVSGVMLRRTTADGYESMCTPCSPPVNGETRLDILGFLHGDKSRPHVATHVCQYIGFGQTAEAGDGSGRVGIHPVSRWINRGGTWGRLPVNNIGRLSGVGIPDWPDMKNGSQGIDVRELKSVMHYLMPSCERELTVTNSQYGPLTEKWVKRLQLLLKTGRGSYVMRGTGTIGAQTEYAIARAIALNQRFS